MTDWDDILKRGAKDRIFYAMQPCWWPYPQAQKVLRELEDLMFFPDNDRPRCLLLTGNSNMGKSRILSEFHATHPPVRDDITGTRHWPSILITMPPYPTAESFLNKIFKTVGLRTNSNSLKWLLDFAESELPQFHSRIFLVDEAQRVNDCPTRDRRYLANTFNELSSILKRPIVAGGTPKTKAYFQSDSQLRGRFQWMELADWQKGPELQAMIKSILENMPLRQGYDPQIYQEEGMIDELLELSKGVTGGLLATIQDGTRSVLRAGGEYLSCDDIRRLTAPFG